MRLSRATRWSSRRFLMLSSTERHDLYLFELLAEEPRTNFPKMRLIVRHHEAMVVTPAVRQQIQPLELPRHRCRRLFRRVHQFHTRTHDPREERLEQRKMRAAQH